MSFIEITQSQVVAPEKAQSQNAPKAPVAAKAEASKEPSSFDESLHAKRMKNEKLFAILSSHSDIDHPICTECTSLLLQSFAARLASATKERDAYASFLKQIQQSATSNTEEDDAKVEKELANLLKQDEQSYEDLLKLEQEKATLEAEIADLEEESRQLDIDEESFWESRNAFDDELHILNTDLASLHQRYEHDQQQLEKLQRTNVYNDTFCIGHDGTFGTINGLRLGRTAEKKIDWLEINAAFGQTLLLLSTIAERVNFKFQGYQLKPMGSTSQIIKLEWPQQAPKPRQSQVSARALTNEAAAEPKMTSLPLFSSGEISVTRMMSASKYDTALVAFLDCLAQLGQHVERTASASNSARPHLNRTPSSRPMITELPYKIEGDKIGGSSIKLGTGFSTDDNFAAACKKALTCLKYMLAILSDLDNQKG